MSLLDYYATFQKKALNCTLCRGEELLDPKASPLFQKCSPLGKEKVIIVMEAPNHDDTYNPQKQYITCDSTTDPTGRFLLRLLKECKLELTDVVLTNAVLCLPREDGSKPRVKGAHLRNCAHLLHHLIESSHIPVVATFGRTALHAVLRLYNQRLMNVGDAVDKQILLPNGVTLLPFFSPSALGRRNRSESDQLKDILALQNFLSLTPDR